MKTSGNNAIPCIFLVLLLLSAIILPGCSGTGREAGNTQAAAPGDAAGPDGPTGGSDVSSSGRHEDSAADGGNGDAPATAVQSPETQDLPNATRETPVHPERTSRLLMLRSGSTMIIFASIIP